jgi:glycosyltransferase involved in cell wall biosynthesis
MPTEPEYEHIIVDDGSTDQTLNTILKHRPKKYRIIVNEENLGLASSSNIAISKARGKYVMRIDCDDLIKPNAIEIMRKKLDETGAMICYANYDEIDTKKKVTKKNIDAQENHHIGCALVNKRWLNEIRFKEGIKHWDGLEVYSRVKDRFPIAYAGESLWYYRVHSKSMSRTNLKERAKCKPALK